MKPLGRRLSRRQWLLVGVGAVLGLTVLSALAVVIFYPRLGAWAVREKALPRLAARLDRDVSAGAIDVGRGKAVLRDVVIAGARDGDEPLLRLDTVEITFDWLATLTGDVSVSAIEIDGAHGRAVRLADGTDNFRDVLARLRPGRADGSAATGAGGGSRLTPDRLSVRSGDFAIRDAATGLTIAADDVVVRAERGGQADLILAGLALTTGYGPEAKVGRVVVTAQLDAPVDTARVDVEGGSVRLWSGMSLTGIAGTLGKGARAGALDLSLTGSYGGMDETLWRADGWIDPLRSIGSVHLLADEFTFDRIRPVLAGTPIVDFDDTSINAKLDIDVRPETVRFAGDVALSGGNLHHRMLAEKVVRDLSAASTLAASFDRKARILTIERVDLRMRGVEASLEGTVHVPGGVEPETGERRVSPRVRAHLVVPEVPCQTMLEAIPPEIVPYLAGFQLRGKFHTDVTFDIDWRDLQQTVLDGSVGIFGCKVRKAPGALDAERLQTQFVHAVEVAVDEWQEFTVGFDNPDFVPIWDVSPHLLNSLMTTEDSSFYKHRGFIVREFRTALIKNLEAGYFRYGASSITMQLVKNVILYREKTLARKLQELFFTWYIETVLDKDRLLEIYVNVIEYGPGIYGIGPAARHYFGKDARDLNPVEAAFFSSILPSPKRRYKQYCKGELWSWTKNKIDRILKLMHKRGRLTAEELELALVTPLVFDRPPELDVRRCLRMVEQAIEAAPSTSPGANAEDADDRDE